ncbi:TraB/GumN family protein [Mucilaginibacter galii]|uniref:Conjugative transfer protein GumN n=1 Tax=Mucilaginibacter galii TaxID=2005073 RepID=A0A917JAS8_9SPHI|nr:TraB/GumN family protein [Mucilaginibacter galii]GGI51152.1 conjugative transfer protein GumN [Mucilaginibacter galii]
MKKTTTVFLGLLSFLLFTCTQNALAQSKGLLWQITGNNIKEPTYLYGTIHMFDTSMYQIPQPVLAKLTQTKQVYFELDFGKINPMEMMKYALVKDSTERLDKLLDSASLQKFRAIAKSSAMLQMMGDNMFRLKPIFLTTMLLNNGKSVAIDMEMYNRAKQLKDSIGGIETVEEQMGAINALSAATQAQMVKEMLKTYTNADDAIKKLTGIYVKQETSTLLAEMSDGAPMDAAFNEALLIKRNIIMASRIEKLVGPKSTMIAVGAGHLGGEQGLIALLKKKGYHFKNVPFTFVKAH